MSPHRSENRHAGCQTSAPASPPVLYLPPPETEAFNSAKSRLHTTLAMLDHLNELAVIALCGVATW
jgi:hypothetical protein